MIYVIWHEYYSDMIDGNKKVIDYYTTSNEMAVEYCKKRTEETKDYYSYSCVEELSTGL